MFWEAVAAQEDGATLVEHTTIFPALSVGLKSFVSWATQWPAEPEKIRSVYTSFASADAETVSGFLHDIALIEESEEVTLRVCLETRGGSIWRPTLYRCRDWGSGMASPVRSPRSLFTHGPRKTAPGRRR